MREVSIYTRQPGQTDFSYFTHVQAYDALVNAGAGIDSGLTAAQVTQFAESRLQHAFGNPAKMEAAIQRQMQAGISRNEVVASYLHSFDVANLHPAVHPPQEHETVQQRELAEKAARIESIIVRTMTPRWIEIRTPQGLRHIPPDANRIVGYDLYNRLPSLRDQGPIWRENFMLGDQLYRLSQDIPALGYHAQRVDTEKAAFLYDLAQSHIFVLSACSPFLPKEGARYPDAERYQPSEYTFMTWYFHGDPRTNGTGQQITALLPSSDASDIARIAESDPSVLKRFLDAFADGVVADQSHQRGIHLSYRPSLLVLDARKTLKENILLHTVPGSPHDTAAVSDMLDRVFEDAGFDFFSNPFAFVNQCI